MIPDSHKPLLEGAVYVILTTLMPDGQPQSTVVWASYDGEYIYVNTAEGRQKPENIRRDPRVTLVAIDTNSPYYWIEVRGKVVEMTEEGGVEHINELA
jgi:PPOX class probable F420-dependent enzyme